MSGDKPAPWLAAQAAALLAQRGHAWLLAGPSGMGQYDLALMMARAWLCDRPSDNGACDNCASCHAVEVRTHADFFLLMPETVMMELGWPLSEKAQSDIDEKKRKASKEIRIEAMRDTIEFSQRTSARGGSKAVMIYPAERMNMITANALLKTLEEPAGDVKFVLATEAASQLLPTIRSRCLTHNMVWPKGEAAIAWIEGRGIVPAQSGVLLRAAGGRPADALLFSQTGLDAQTWLKLPQAIAKGDISSLKDWSPAQVVDALHKMCHDCLAVIAGGKPRFFDAADLPAGGSVVSLTSWAQKLAMITRSIEHPFNASLMVEALVSQAQNALNSR